MNTFQEKVVQNFIFQSSVTENTFFYFVLKLSSQLEELHANNCHNLKYPLLCFNNLCSQVIMHLSHYQPSSKQVYHAIITVFSEDELPRPT